MKAKAITPEVLEFFEYSEDSPSSLLWKKDNTQPHNKNPTMTIVRNKRGSIAGRLGENGYWVVRVKSEDFKVHRLVYALLFYDDPGAYIDHKDGNRSNNKVSNLRVVNKACNARNQRKHFNSFTGVAGVGWIEEDETYYAFYKDPFDRNEKGCSKMKSKYFNVNKYMEFTDPVEKAFNEACTWRATQISQINKKLCDISEVEYTERHGK